MTEVWKDIPGYEGRYQVSDAGRVKALPRRLRFVSKAGAESWRTTKERVCAINVTRNGYALVHFQVDRERAVKTVHELVMAAFVGSRPEGMDINHKDGVKTSNALSNLEYVTPVENHNHAVRLGLNKQAKRVQRLAGCRVDAVFASMTSAAKSIGVTQGSIAYALRNSTVCGGYRWVYA